MKNDILDQINSPKDLKNLAERDIPKLCEELRHVLVESVEKNGGHLASNLGVTELTVALHRVFDSPKDHIIFDVGHQAYVHKILTGRKDRFDDLRAPGGLSGFTFMRESEHDAFGAGHSSTSISAALGYAEAAAIRGSGEYTVCVVGDGAYTGGMVHEAFNNCKPNLRLIIVLNENGMAISSNKGNYANYLSKLRISVGHSELNGGASTMLQNANYFEMLGLHYIGPVDGNDYKEVVSALKRAKSANKCVVVHLKTVKGKGYEPAENSPIEFHSMKSTSDDTEAFNTVFVNELVKIAENDKKITAVTAAMGPGTGIDRFGELYPTRYFDVGIAEEHALTFSAGLAAAGFSPYVATYSTFLQRGYDSIIHDIALQALPVKIVIDRAGLAVFDGATHHGIFDVSFLSHIPHIYIYAPATYAALSRVVIESSDAKHPVAIRYPNSQEHKFVAEEFVELLDDELYPFMRADFSFDSEIDVMFVTYGHIVEEVREAKKHLIADGISSGIILVECIKPYDKICDRILSIAKKAKQIIYVEEGIKNGGAAMITETILCEKGLDLSKTKYNIIAIDDNFASPDEPCCLYDFVGLSSKKIYEKCKYILGRS